MSWLSRPKVVLGRIPVPLPVPIYTGGDPIRIVWCRPLDGQGHLDGGVMPLVLSEQQDLEDDPKKVDEIEKHINQAVLAALCKPLGTFGEPDSTHVRVQEIDFRSRAAIYDAVTGATVSLYYGRDRGMRGSISAEVKQGQLEVYKFYYRCCSELGDNIDSILHLDDPALALRLSVLQAGDAMKAQALRAAKRQNRKNNPGGGGSKYPGRRRPGGR